MLQKALKRYCFNLKKKKKKEEEMDDLFSSLRIDRLKRFIDWTINWTGSIPIPWFFVLNKTDFLVGQWLDRSI